MALGAGIHWWTGMTARVVEKRGPRAAAQECIDIIWELNQILPLPGILQEAHGDDRMRNSLFVLID